LISITAEQIKTLGTVCAQAFGARMAAHLMEVFPGQCERLGEARLSEIVETGIARAGQYGVRREREFCLWLHLMFVLGGQFDADPNLPWVRSILQDPALFNPIHKVHRLYEAAERRARPEGR